MSTSKGIDYESKLSGSSQIYVPVKIQEMIGVEEGDKVIFRIDEDWNVRLVPKGDDEEEDGKFTDYHQVSDD